MSTRFLGIRAHSGIAPILVPIKAAIGFLPVMLMAVLFGLAMDYEVFLVSRMREEYVHGAAPRDAVVTGARHAARVVVAAALIMFSVFASFITIDDVIVKAIALGLAVGIVVVAAAPAGPDPARPRRRGRPAGTRRRTGPHGAGGRLTGCPQAG